LKFIIILSHASTHFQKKGFLLKKEFNNQKFNRIKRQAQIIIQNNDKKIKYYIYLRTISQKATRICLYLESVKIVKMIRLQSFSSVRS